MCKWRYSALFIYSTDFIYNSLPRLQLFLSEGPLLDGRRNGSPMMDADMSFASQILAFLLLAAICLGQRCNIGTPFECDCHQLSSSCGDMLAEPAELLALDFQRFESVRKGQRNDIEKALKGKLRLWIAQECGAGLMDCKGRLGFVFLFYLP